MQWTKESSQGKLSWEDDTSAEREVKARRQPCLEAEGGESPRSGRHRGSRAPVMSQGPEEVRIAAARGAVGGHLTKRSWHTAFGRCVRFCLLPRGWWEMEIVLSREQKSAVGFNRSLWMAGVEDICRGDEGGSSCNARGCDQSGSSESLKR